MFTQDHDGHAYSETMVCPHCSREFELIVYEERGYSERESIACHYDDCGKFVDERRISGSFRTRLKR